MLKEHSVVGAGSPCETMGAPILEATLSFNFCFQADLWSMRAGSTNARRILSLTVASESNLFLLQSTVSFIWIGPLNTVYLMSRH